MSRLLLCTDLDRTLLPNGQQPESVNARQRFHSLADSDAVTLVYVTGRHKILVEDAIQEYGIPVPDYVITDVGASIYKVKGSKWECLEPWQQHIAKDWRGLKSGDVMPMFSDIKELKLQETEKQSPFKLSYYVSPSIDITQLIHTVKMRMQAEKLISDVIWSIDEEKDIGLFDVMPASANKRHAIEYVMTISNFGLNETLFAGDSGNDISVMASEIKSIVVNNAMPAVKVEAVAQAESLGLEHALYLAKGNYLGMNGNYSAGILEGVAHYMPSMEKYFK